MALPLGNAATSVKFARGVPPPAVVATVHAFAPSAESPSANADRRTPLAPDVRATPSPRSTPEPEKYPLTSIRPSVNTSTPVAATWLVPGADVTVVHTTVPSARRIWMYAACALPLSGDVRGTPSPRSTFVPVNEPTSAKRPSGKARTSSARAEENPVGASEVRAHAAVPSAFTFRT